ncbi:tetratricopeptide repeat protein [Aeoliella sp. SH292]|uniref:tetratricopeptide repeat protein n=1 Tax=Aeoliella sp. SH292 TaxID=3454464 RepID=UPI003F9DA482
MPLALRSLSLLVFSLALLLVLTSVPLVIAAPEKPKPDAAPAVDPATLESSETPDDENTEEGDDDSDDREDSGEEAADDSDEPAPGQEDLDKATQLKLTATDGKQVNDVIQLLASAMKKGLDKENEAFAKQMLASTLMERGAGLARVLLEQPLPNPQQDPRWLQLRVIALSDLAQAVKLDPAENEAWILIGRLQQLPQGDPKAAASAYGKVIDAKDVEPAVLAEAYARRATAQTDPGARLTDLNGAIEAETKNINYRLLRARHFMGEEELDKALDDIDAAIEISEDEYAAHELRGLVLNAQGRTEEAFKAFDRASEAEPGAIMPYLQRAEMYGQQGDLENAIDQANKAIDREESNPLCYLLRAELYLRNEQPKEALADADKMLELNPTLAPAVLLKARAYEGLGEDQKALEQLEILGKAAPGRADLELQIAMFALKLEMPRRAIEALDRAIEGDPKNALLYRFRGDSKLNVGMHAEAVADYEEAMKLDPEDSGVLNNLAWTLATSPDDPVRDGKRAVELATKACEMTDFKTAHIVSTLAAAYAETGDFENAKKYVKQAIELNDEENSDAIKKELESYEQGKPVRERQQLDSGEREGGTPKADDEDEEERKPNRPSGTTPAPRRSIDF